MKTVEFNGLPCYQIRAGDFYINGDIPENLDEDDYILLVKSGLSPIVDDYREFPAKSELENIGPFYTSGIAKHTAHNREAWYDMRKHEEPIKLSSLEIEVFAEDDWYGECFQVLDAHGWMSGLSISKDILTKVKEFEPSIDFAKLFEKYEDNWRYVVYERAAYHLTPPLSRIWYVANMLRLYFIENDDMRLGFLWSEYRQRMQVEPSVALGRKIVAAAKRGGEARQASTIDRSSQIVSRIQSFIENGHSVSRAATLVADAGIGTSADANRKLFYRAKKDE